MVEVFESLIGDQARLNPSSMAENRLKPFLSSSLILAKIKILASTAIPIERIKPAMPDKVMVVEVTLKAAKVRVV